MTDQCSHAHGNAEDQEYDQYLQRIKARFDKVAVKNPNLFTTNAKGLWDAYLAGFPEEERQYYNCHACRRFIETYGGLVTIDDHGEIRSAIWSCTHIPNQYLSSVAAMIQIICRSYVTGIFLSKDKIWGQPVTGIWTHFSVTPPRSMIFNKQTMTAGQAMAEKREDFKNVIYALAEFSIDQLNQVVTLLENEVLQRSEAALGPMRWLRDLSIKRSSLSGRKASNIVGKAVAAAPPGFCHPRSSVGGTILSDIAAGYGYNEVVTRFNAKMQPLNYQRPQTAPSSGNVALAEKIVKQLGIKESLRRRYARLDEIQSIWTPTTEETTGASVDSDIFAHLNTKNEAPKLNFNGAPAKVMTWEKFHRTVLIPGNALEIELRTQPYRQPYAALVTAADPDAPPIIQWDCEKERNPITWYLYNTGSLSQEWNLASSAWHKVKAVSFKPSMWNHSEFNVHYGKGVIFIIEGCRDTQNPSMTLFPNFLKSDLYPIHSTIEAFSKAGKLEGHEESSACGRMFSGNCDEESHSVLLRVRTATGTINYKLDRWD